MLNSTRINNKILLYILVLALVLCIVIFPMQSANCYAKSGVKFNSTNVLDDLKSSTVNGKPFDIAKYPYSEKGTLKVIDFVEYCYSFRENQRANYDLYLYVYNPQAINISTDSKRNKVQMAVAYVGNGAPTRYEKFNIELCSKSDGNYKNLFYKFKVVDKKIDGKTFADRVNSNERKYDISGIELLTYGNPNATEYTIGGSYKFTGYAEGLGPEVTAKSTLNCIVENLETLSLEVHHTNFRTNVSSIGKGHYNEVNTVYFSVPERIFNDYGKLQKIHAEWWEYKTKMAAITSNAEFYNIMKANVGKYAGEYNSEIPFKLYSGLSAISNAGTTSFFADWVYNFERMKENGGIIPTYTTMTPNSYSDMLPFAFYSEKVDIDSVFKFLYSDPIAGSVKSTVVKDWINNYSNNLGHGYIDCNGRQISKDLFESSVDSGRNMGYNNVNIDLADTFNLNSYDSNHNWWDKLWDYGFSWPQTNGDYKNIAPIYEVKDSDLVGSNSTISTRLLVNEDDVSNLQTFFASEKIKGNRTILFRFANTDYYSEAVGRSGSGFTEVPEDKSDTYIAQQTVFFDFDIIDLTFNKDGEYRVIPVVSSPIDIVNGFTPPAPELEWWKMLLGVVLLIILLIVLFPLLPYLIKGVLWVITLPIKGVKMLIKACRKKEE